MTRTTDPTIRTDWKSRVIAFDIKSEALNEAKLWRESGHKTRIILRRNVYNIVITQ